jgi:hypothetical protein
MTGDEPVKFLVMDAIANEKCRVPKVDSDCTDSGDQQ